MIDYASAGDWFAADGTADAGYHEDPFGAPLVGHNALRAYLLQAAASQRDVEFTVERHWVAGETALAGWHATFVRRATGDFVRLAGFLTAEVAPDGRVSRFRGWWHTTPGTAG